jgi:hypothetical protein
VLPYIDPSVPGRSRWMGIISALKNSDFTGADDDFDVEDIVVRWSAGEFWNGQKDAPRWLSDGTPANFVGGTEKHPIPGDVAAREAFKTSNGNATFGTLVHHAKESGWTAQPPWSGDIAYGYIPESNNVVQDAPAPKPAGIKLLGVDDIFAMPDPVELVSGMLIERENVAFVGVPKCGKTFLALEIAMCIAANRPVLGKRMVRRPGVVVYLSGEGHGGMKRRIAAWCKSHGVDRSVLRGKFFYHVGVPASSLDTNANLAAAKAYIEGIRAIHGEPVLIVIDTMARSLGGLDENAANSAAAYLQLTEVLRNSLQCTILTLAHASDKGKPGAKINVRGSSAFIAGFDAGWIVEKYDDTGTVVLSADRLKDADLEDMPPLHFRLKKVDLGEGKSGAALEAVEGAAARSKLGKFARQDNDQPVIDILINAQATGFLKGFTHQQMAEAMNGPRPAALPMGASEERYAKFAEEDNAWQSAVNKTYERIRKRVQSVDSIAGLGSMGAEAIGSQRNVWKWHLK